MKPGNNGSTNIDGQYFTLLKLWFAICMSVLGFLALTYFVIGGTDENRQLSLILSGLGVGPVGLSFLLKQRMLAKSVTTQQVNLVQTAYVLSFALCESSALLGVVNHFVTGSGYYFLAFAIAGLGMLLHFPQKKDVVNAASYRPL
jgi:hypothetical protein